MNWNQYATIITKLERKHLPAVTKAISSYKKDFTNKAKAEGLNVAVRQLNTQPIDPDIIRVLTEIYKSGGVAGARATNQELKQNLKWRGLGQNLQWINSVLSYLKINILKLASNITDTTREDILKVLSNGIKEGWSVDMIVAGINDPDVTKARARVIVRTESVRSFSVGNTIGAQTFPFEVNKTWRAAHDHRTRHSHVKADGQTVGEHESFTVDVYKGDKRIGSEQMMFPGDPKATPGNTINCRCRCVFTSKKTPDGRPIPRTGAQVLTLPHRR